MHDIWLFFSMMSSQNTGCEPNLCASIVMTCLTTACLLEWSRLIYGLTRRVHA